MKNGKKPTVKQSIFIRSHGHKPESWLVTKDTPKLMELVHKEARKVITINKDEERIIV